jgi:formylglycine-generating enzyme required for sulfatase activity
LSVGPTPQANLTKTDRATTSADTRPPGDGSPRGVLAKIIHWFRWRRPGAWLKKHVFTLVASLITVLLSLWLGSTFQEYQKARIDLSVKSWTLGTLGRIVVLQGTTVIEEDRFAPCPKPECFQATLRLPQGFYEILVYYLDHRYQVVRQSFGRRDHVHYWHCDERWHIPEFFDNSEFVSIPAGRFLMGTREERDATPHRVELEEFSIRAKPVSQAEYDLFLLQERHETPHEQRTKDDLSKPAVYLTWYDAKEFCDWVTRLKNNGATYRLPTEAEYERAMRQRGPGLTYPWGNEELDRSEDPPLRRANYRQAGVEPKVLPIGTFPPVDGLYDIAGNVWSWTSNWYEDNYYSSPAALRNPKGPPDRPYGRRVLRGGSCEDPTRDLRSGHRGKADPTITYYNAGFRVVRYDRP